MVHFTEVNMRVFIVQLEDNEPEMTFLTDIESKVRIVKFLQLVTMIKASFARTGGSWCQQDEIARRLRSENWSLSAL